MSLVNSFEDSLLSLIFNNDALPNLGSAAGLQPSTGPGDIYVALHTGTPGETAADQSVSECAYTSYARQTALRSTAGWLIAGTAPTVADNVVAIQMQENTGSSETSTHFGLGFAVSGATTLYMTGVAALVVSPGVNPEFAIGALDVQLD